MSYRPPEPLGPAHELGAFVCDSAEQTEWLVRHARQSMAMGTTKVFVVTPVDSDQVVAYSCTASPSRPAASTSTSSLSSSPAPPTSCTSYFS